MCIISIIKALNSYMNCHNIQIVSNIVQKYSFHLASMRFACILTWTLNVEFSVENLNSLASHHRCIIDAIIESS